MLKRIINVAATSLLFAIILVISSCSAEIPEDYVETDVPATVTPDNDGAVIPPNIAPLNFSIKNEADKYVTHIHTRNAEGITIGGRDVDIPTRQWQQLLAEATGDTLFTDIYIRQHDKWLHCPTRHYVVAEDEIDPYITYRLIHPGYVGYEDMSICERELVSFNERVIYSNMPFNKGESGQCVNCHSYQDYNRGGNMQMHLRERMGGTLIVKDGKIEKVNLATDSIAAGRYPAWHPTLPLIAYSVNATGQVFHTRDTQKIEVIDFGSDLVLYDVEAHTVMPVSMDKDEYETFPTWSPDGKWLYYTSAHHHQWSDDIDAELDAAYDSLHYNIYRRAFNAQTRSLGERELVFDADAVGKSAAVPRISPTGRFMLFTLADYGNFHIWHHSADLYAMELSTGEVRPLTEANSPTADSYHAWSSNGRWILFASRRDDGNYTRLYIAYFDRNGQAHRPFLLPQRRPDYYADLMRSYNVPEFMVKPVSASRRQLRNSAKKEAVKVQMRVP